MVVGKAKGKGEPDSRPTFTCKITPHVQWFDGSKSCTRAKSPSQIWAVLVVSPGGSFREEIVRIADHMTKIGSFVDMVHDQSATLVTKPETSRAEVSAHAESSSILFSLGLGLSLLSQSPAGVLVVVQILFWSVAQPVHRPLNKHRLHNVC